MIRARAAGHGGCGGTGARGGRADVRKVTPSPHRVIGIGTSHCPSSRSPETAVAWLRAGRPGPRRLPEVSGAPPQAGRRWAVDAIG